MLVLSVQLVSSQSASHAAARAKRGKKSRCTRPQAHKVAVIGSGIIGLSTAYQLISRYQGVSVTLIADRRYAETTSHGSGGLWMPYALAGTPDALLHKWGHSTFRHFVRLYRSSNAAKAGVLMSACISLFTESIPDKPFWWDIVFDYRELNTGDLAARGFDGMRAGVTFETLIADQNYYLPWLWGQLHSVGKGRIEFREATLSSVEDLDGEGYSVIFNCAGLGSRRLVPDKACYPTRGQVRRVRAPWIKHACFLDDDGYLIPNLDTLVVGGTAQGGDWRTEVDGADTSAMWQRMTTMWPSLLDAEVVKDWAGLRPSREGGVCLAREERAGGKCPVVHNYGHGGSGVTLHWGCAEEAVGLGEQELASVP